MKILSMSDLITNSSSEVFCYINGSKDEIQIIEEILDTIFGYNQELEVTPCMDKLDSNNLTIELPYHMLKNDNYVNYWIGALEGLLKDFHTCKIDYE